MKMLSVLRRALAAVGAVPLLAAPDEPRATT
jgi:hypothetical protein